MSTGANPTRFAGDSGISFSLRSARPAFSVLLVALLGLAGCSRSATGLYVHKSSHGLARLQLVEAPEQHLTGQLDIVGYDANGKWISRPLAVEGSRDGSAVSLTLKSPGVSLDALLASGQFSWGRLKLIGNFGAGIKTVVFESATDADYQTALQALRVAEQKIVQASQIAEQQRAAAQIRTQWISSVDEFITKMNHFEAEAPKRLDQWNRTRAALAAVTQDMNKKLNLERKLSGQAYYVQRGQISVAINQEEIGTEQFESAINNLNATLGQNIASRIADARRANDTCKTPRVMKERTLFPELADACTRLSNALSAAEPVYSEVVSGLAQLELTYRNERQRQTAIIAESDRIE